LRLPQDFGVALDPTRRCNGIDALRRANLAGRPVPVQLLSVARVLPGPLSAKTVVGRVTSAAWSQAREEGVAVGWLDPAVAKAGATLSAGGPNGPVEVKIAMTAAKQA